MSDDYESKSAEELHALAGERNIEGRSSMNKEQLVEALRSQDTNPQGDVGAANAPTTKDVGQAEVKEAVDEATAKGYYGTVPDETPNSHYTVAGVTSGKPTPENTRTGLRAAQTHADHFGDLEGKNE